MGQFDDFIDLVASGDEQKIKCVLTPAIGGAAMSGALLAPLGPVGMGLAAVLGGLGAYLTAYRMCGAGATQGGFQRMLSDGRLPARVVNAYEAQLASDFGLSPEQARYVTASAVVFLRWNYEPVNYSPSPAIERQGVMRLLSGAGRLG